MAKKRGAFKNHRSHLTGSRAKHRPFGKFGKPSRDEIREWVDRMKQISLVSLEWICPCCSTLNKQDNIQESTCLTCLNCKSSFILRSEEVRSDHHG